MRDPRTRAYDKDAMRIALALILIILWLLGVVGTYAVGRSVDLLLVIAVIFLVLELRRGAV